MSHTESMKKGPPYALIPVPTVASEGKDDFREKMCFEMASAHNAFIRGINNAYEKAPRILPEDEHAFAGYCLAMLGLIHHHHDAEEEIFFPLFSTVVAVNQNVEQHAAMHAPMEALQEYMKGVQAGPVKYDGQEMPTVAPEHLRKLNKADMDAAIKKQIEQLSMSSLTIDFPWMLGHADTANYPNWPEAPNAFKWTIKNIISRWYGSYWKFSPFDLYGQPQNYIGKGI
ncbi:hypothetical protein AX16_006785 [Volvariella volvacea WC 439]|nr:hypothetical protein AX16_006785 [Volvariella volvacea WC 439]